MPKYLRIRKPNEAELDAFTQNFKERFVKAAGKSGADFKGIHVDESHTKQGTILSLRFRGALSEGQKRIVRDLVIK